MGSLGGVKIVNLAQALSSIDNFVDNVDNAVLEGFKYAGETFIRHARLNREFEDDTGNLQSSIGYIIGKDGKEMFEAVNGADEYIQEHEGRAEGLRLARAVLKENSNGWVLIGVAGMEYGIYVEARGINVISFSVPGAQKLIQEILNSLK